jgi:hypothetical protein
MLACNSGVECQPQYNNKQQLISPSKGVKNCGSDFAYVYFCSFVFLSSFLVKNQIFHFELNVILLDVEFVCGGYYGQF